MTTVEAHRRAEIHASASSSLRRRKITGTVARALCTVAMAGALATLLAVIVYTVGRGIGAWSAAFFTHLPTPAGIPGGGISNALVGSLIIDGMAILMAVPFGIAAGLFLAEQDGAFARTVRFTADVLAGVPSIALGLFAYAILVVTLGHFSAFAGSVALGILMLPIVMRTTEAAIRSVPRDIWESGLALGIQRSRVSLRIILPSALPGVTTGVLLGISRMAGETAPLLFTAIGSQYFAVSPAQPMAALPLVVYLDGIQAYPDIQQIAWGTALALIVIVLGVNLGGRIFVRRMRRMSA
ncbi:MAG: phosphate ABC transporter permease PstA [Candidatus Dormiibacterota bacterium]